MRILTKTKMVLRIAHRGASGHALENSMEAFSKALKFKPDFIELDVRSTRDNKVVVMHDMTTVRTGMLWRRVKWETFDRLMECKLKNGEKIPTLNQVLKFLKGKCKCKIDMKDHSIEEQVADSVMKYDFEKEIIIASGLEDVLVHMKMLLPQAMTEFLTQNPFRSTRSIIDQAKRIKVDIIGLHYWIASKRFIQAIKDAGLKVNVWTVNNKKMIENLKLLRVHSITSDYPEMI